MEKKMFVLSTVPIGGVDCTVLGVFDRRDLAARVVLTCIFEDEDTAVQYEEGGNIGEEVFTTKKYQYKIEEFEVNEFY